MGEFEGVIVLFALLGIAVLVLNIWIAGAFYSVAKDKGYTESRYWLLPFFFPITGYILVAALPDRSASKPLPNAKNATASGADFNM